MTYKKLRSPIWWFGGKGNMTAKLLPYTIEEFMATECNPFRAEN